MRSQKVLRIATVGADGTPHIAPVWYRYSGKKIHIGTNTGTQKARNAKRNGRVSFCVDTGINSPDIYGVMGQGEAALLEGRRVRAIAEKILLRYFETLEDRSAKELLDDTDCIIEIVPDRFSVWSY